MSDEVVFYSNPMSRGGIVHWMLEEAGAPYRYELVDLQAGEQKKPNYLAINPMGKVPAIFHRGVVVTECSAICAYLADAFPAARLAPSTDSPLRGSYYRWLFFAAACVDAAVVDRMLERPPVARTGALGYGTLETTLETLEKAVAPGPYILGTQFTAADVVVGSQINFGIMTKGIEPRPVFQEYAKRLTGRPAFQRSTEQGNKITERLKQAS